MRKNIVKILTINVFSGSSVTLLPCSAFFFAVLTLKYKVLLILTKNNKL